MIIKSLYLALFQMPSHLYLALFQMKTIFPYKMINQALLHTVLLREGTFTKSEEHNLYLWLSGTFSIVAEIPVFQN